MKKLIYALLIVIIIAVVILVGLNISENNKNYYTNSLLVDGGAVYYGKTHS